MVSEWEMIKTIATDIMGWTPTYITIQDMSIINWWGKVAWEGGLDHVAQKDWNPFTDENASAQVLEKLAIRTITHQCSLKLENIKREWYCSIVWNGDGIAKPHVSCASRKRAIALCAYEIAKEIK